MQPHEVKRLIDSGVTLLIDACDTDDVLWATRMTGQDSEEAEASGYLAGYRDALAAMQQIIGHNNPNVLNNYLDQVREEMLEAQNEVEEEDDGPHFWNT